MLINRVEYLRTLDGDTIEVNIRGVHPVFGEKIKVRFADIHIENLYHIGR